MALTPTTSPLKIYILDELRRSGPTTFERYMELCLYHPEFGYYTQGRERTGVRGDYFTSCDLHPIFARLVARQAAEMWETLGRPGHFEWVEMGAGRGLFAHDFLTWVQASRRDFLAALDYRIVEPAPRARDLLAERLKGKGLGGSVRLLADLEELSPVTGCFFSNELVDAFPVACVARAGGRLKEIYVEARGETLGEKLGPVSEAAVAAAVARYAGRLEDGHRVEVNLQAARWIRSVAKKLTQGYVLTFDYGDLAERLFTPDRPRGTLLAYRGHLADEDFFSAPGEQDLTAHVNFSALMDAGSESGLELTGFTTQERFLLALGEADQFADLYDAGETDTQKLDARLKLKRLLNPEGMGTVFKALVQHKGVARPSLTCLKYER